MGKNQESHKQMPVDRFLGNLLDKAREKAETEIEMSLMKTLDDAWNSQDCDTIAKRHTRDHS